MKLNEEQRVFMREHVSDDIPKLLLKASRYPNLDVPFLCDQLLIRRHIREKLPTWYANEDLLFPAKITAEQCSSEQTALYKQRLVQPTDKLCDLTGGLGIDSFYFSLRVQSVCYVERFSEYCNIARDNFEILGARNIQIIHGDSVDCLNRLCGFDVFYIDPARRGKENKRVYALSDCEPNLPALLPELLSLSPRVIAKISPMADLQQTLSVLPGTVEIHVLSVRNECKELLFDIRRERLEGKEPVVHAVNFTSVGEEEVFEFTISEERDSLLSYAKEVRHYLYEPNASLMKAGAFKIVALRYGLEKLQVNSHLYASDALKVDFPGRIFEVEKVYPFNNRQCKELGREIPKANIAVRNFPLSADELKKKCQIKDGGDVFLFGTTLSNGDRVLIRGHKV